MVTLLDHNAHLTKSADKFGPQPKIAVPPSTSTALGQIVNIACQKEYVTAS